MGPCTEVENSEKRSKRKRKEHDYSKLEAGRQNTQRKLPKVLPKPPQEPIEKEIDEIDIKDEPLEDIIESDEEPEPPKKKKKLAIPEESKIRPVGPRKIASKAYWESRKCMIDHCGSSRTATPHIQFFKAIVSTFKKWDKMGSIGIKLDKKGVKWDQNEWDRMGPFRTKWD